MKTEFTESYETRIKEILKEASAEGVVFTEREVARLVREAYSEMSDATARRMFGAT